jgi:hypothetical protein
MLRKKKENKWCPSFNFTFRYIDDILSLTNSTFGDFVDPIYPNELEIKDTTNTVRSASYLDIDLDIESEVWLRTKLYDKGDVFKFPIINFPFISNNLAALIYRVYISQLIRYSRACGSYRDYLDRGYLLTRNLMNHCFLVINLKSSLLKFNGCSPYDIYVSKVTTYMFCHNNNLILSSFMTYLIFLVFLCCIIMCFYVLTSELWYPLRFPHKNDGQFVFTNTYLLTLLALKSDSTHHFSRNACIKSGSLRFSQFSGCWLILSVYILMSFDFPFVRLLRVP